MWTPAVTITPPTAEPITLAAAKEFLRLDAEDDGFDSEVDEYIADVRDEAERISSTRLISQTVEVGCSCFADLASLPIGPVASVTSVKYLDTAGVEQTLSGSAYELFGAGLAKGVRLTVGSSWPALRPCVGAVRVRLAVGYGAGGSDLPPTVRVALLRALRGRFDDKSVDLGLLLTNDRIWL